MKRGLLLLTIVLASVLVGLGQTKGGVVDTVILKQLNASQKRELESVFPRKTRLYMLSSKSLFIVETKSKRRKDLENLNTRREFLDALFLDTARAKNVQDTCRTPEYWIETENSEDSKVAFIISYSCNDVTGGGVDFHLIQGRIDGKTSQSRILLESLFGDKR